MKFLADMGVSIRSVEWLRTLGHDAVHLSEEKLHRLPDNEVLKKAKAENRILLTMDLDFSRLVSSAGIENLPTVIIFRLNDQRPQNVNQRLSVILKILEDTTSFDTSILSVSENKIRVRKLKF
jgi:predicted nuclease of predicted toxin-antitoxin system